MNIGTVGTSWITSAFIDALKEEGTFHLHAVYSRTEKKAEEFAMKHDAPHFFTDIEAMAKDKEIDCVYIASPNAMHIDHAITFLQNKKHVICEKPIFSNQKELEKAYQVAKENNVYLFEAMRHLQTPGFKVLKENIKKCGQVRSVVLNYAKYSSRYTNVLQGEEPNIFSLKFSGGALVDLGVYPLAAAISLFGKPVQATYSPVKISTGVDGCGTLILQYPSFTCTILCSKISTSFNLSEIQGEQGTFTIDNIGAFSEVTYTDIHSGEKTVMENDQTHHDMFYEIAAFADIIGKDNTAEYNTLKEISRNVLEITEKVRKENGIVFGVEG